MSQRFCKCGAKIPPRFKYCSDCAAEAHLAIRRRLWPRYRAKHYARRREREQAKRESQDVN